MFYHPHTHQMMDAIALISRSQEKVHPVWNLYELLHMHHCCYSPIMSRDRVISMLLFLFFFEFLEGVLPSGVDASEVAWLEECQPPESFVVHRGPYRGQIVNNQWFPIHCIIDFHSDSLFNMGENLGLMSVYLQQIWFQWLFRILAVRKLVVYHTHTSGIISSILSLVEEWKVFFNQGTTSAVRKIIHPYATKDVFTWSDLCFRWHDLSFFSIPLLLYAGCRLSA